MGKKQTQEEIEKRIHEVNPNLTVVAPYNYEKKSVRVKCNICDNEWDAYFYRILKTGNCRFCTRKRMAERMTKSSDKFMEEFAEKGNPNIEILGKYVNINHKILTRCKKNSNHVWDAWPEVLLRGVGCPFCNNKRVSPSKENSVGVVYPELLKCFKNKEDAYKYTPHSNVKVPMVCPICGREKSSLVMINDLVSNGFKCDFCSDKISRPNKFLHLLLFYLKEKGLIKDFNLEYNPSWGKKYLYDGFVITLNGEKFLIEMQGIQHYTNCENLYTKGIKKRDEEKLLLAQENKMFVVYIDCSDTTFSNMKSKILDSEISQKIDLSKVNWELIEKQIEKNQIKELCNFYNNNPQLTFTDISKIKKIALSTVRKRLKIGNDLGWCNLNSDVESKINKIFWNLKPIIVTYSDGRVEKFVSVTETRIGLGFNFNTVVYNILKKGGSYKDYNIRYANEEETKEIKEKWIIEQKSKMKNSLNPT